MVLFTIRRGLSLLLVAAALQFATVDLAEAAKRVALLIGNQDYSTVGQLANPGNDVALMKKALEEAGFDSVDTAVDLGIMDMKKALRSFEDKVAGSEVALIYYSGHGMEMSGVNYVIPVDAVLSSDKDVEDEALSLDRLERTIEGASRLKLVILDACRNNPFAETMKRSISTRAVGRGLAKVEPESADMLVAFASKAGTVALDGEGANSPFATALAKYLVEPGLDVRIALGKVRDEVVQLTNHNQEPFVYGSLGGAQIFLNIKELNITINNTDGDQKQNVSPNTQSEAATDWQNIRDLADKDLLDAFIAKHGKDPVYKMLAEKKLKLIEEAETKTDTSADEIAWEALKGSSDAAALTRFIERYPDSAHKEEAQLQIAALEPQKGLAIHQNTDQAAEDSPAQRECYLLAGEPQSLPGFAGVQTLKIDAKRALSSCAQAVNERPDDGMLLDLLGRAHDADHNYAEARSNYEKAVKQGNLYAQTNLGWYAVYGTNEPVDVNKGRDLFEKAAISGNAYAQASLGYLYREGYGGITQDYSEAVKWYQQAANQGYANAMASMGWLYREGKGVDVDYVQSLQWYTKGAEAGDVNAMSSLGYAYQNGIGTAVDMEQAKKWYEAAANQDDSYSMASLGFLYDAGNGVKQDYAEARYWYEKAANSGSSYAMGNLSRLYDFGLGTKADAKEAVRWAAAAIESGENAKLDEMKNTPANFSPAFRTEMQKLLNERGLYTGPYDGEFGPATLDALTKLAGQDIFESLKIDTTKTDKKTSTVTAKADLSSGKSAADECYALAGEPGSEPNYPGVNFADIQSEKAIPVCSQAIAENPADSMLVNMLGRAYDAEHATKDARTAYQKASDAGNLYALTNLGWYAIYGTDEAQDVQKGLGMFERAADANIAYAQASIGWVYREAYGVERDYRKSISYYQKAADQNYANAQSAMGWFYREGAGVMKDVSVSLDYYKKGADGGDVNAMSSVGYAYQNGLGTAVDNVEARFWYEKAAAKNDFYSMASLGYLYDIGLGVAQNYDTAFNWYSKAADGGNTYAMGRLTYLYDQGLGVDKNPAEAARWAIRSLKGGDRAYFEELTGTPGNYSKAFLKEIQSQAKQEGTYSGKVDGDFGVATKNALQKLMPNG